MSPRGNGGKKHVDVANNGQPGGRDYYPTIDELVNSSNDGFKHLTDKLTKDSILCFLKDSIGHLREAKLNLSNISFISEKIEDLKRENEKLVEKVEKINEDLPKSGKAIPQTVATPIRKIDDYQCQLKFIELPENDIKFSNERHLKEKLDAEAVISRLGGNPDTADCRRLGRFDTQKKRPLLVSFKSIWDKRKCLALAIQNKLFQTDKILIVPELSPEERTIEKKLLAKRYQLINEGTDKSRIRIRNLKLFCDGIEVTVE